MSRRIGMIGLAALVVAAGARSRPYGDYSLHGFQMHDPEPPISLKAKALDLTGALDPKPKGKRGKRRRKRAPGAKPSSTSPTLTASPDALQDAEGIAVARSSSLEDPSHG